VNKTRPKSASIGRFTRHGKPRNGQPLEPNPLIKEDPERFARELQEGIERSAGAYFRQFDFGVVIDSPREKRLDAIMDRPIEEES
jgi:hypothetical protein